MKPNGPGEPHVSETLPKTCAQCPPLPAAVQQTLCSAQPSICSCQRGEPTAMPIASVARVCRVSRVCSRARGSGRARCAPSKT